MCARDAPIPTSPQRKSGLPDLRTILRNPGKPGLRGEVPRLHRHVVTDYHRSLLWRVFR